MVHFRLILLLLVIALVACKSNKNNEPLDTQISPAKYSVKGDQIISISGDYNISGVYPHLTTYTHFRANGRQSYIPDPFNPKALKSSWECGIGAIMPWYGKLYMINYAAHMPYGSEHKLYIIDSAMNMRIFEGSVGGTPAARMVHRESKQLFIGHYAIDTVGNIRVIDIKKMPGRLSAIARHLTDPENKVYYYDMEGMLYELNVHTLEPKLLYKNPLPGWHGKGAYSSQGKLVIANNGENKGELEPIDLLQVDTLGIFGPEMNGVLAEFDGEKFSVIERRQFTDVTTKNGPWAVNNDQSPLWAIGWDKRSLRLKVLDKGQWNTYLLPKAAYNNDPSHGWFTEWPRIREIDNGKFMMDMHGMFFEFPSTFSAQNSKGIKPIASHIRYIPDFTFWNGKLVLATDETSIQGNQQAGQPQSNLWFGTTEQLSEWGPKSAYGSIYINDKATANIPSLPFLFNGFDNRMVHLFNHSIKAVKLTFEVDKQGSNNFQKLINVELPPYSYSNVIFTIDQQGEWIRIVTHNDAILTATFHYTDKYLRKIDENDETFKSVASASQGQNAIHAKLYANHDNFNLSAHLVDLKPNSIESKSTYELNKFDFIFRKGLNDSSSLKTLENEEIWFEDSASVVLKTTKGNLRLPKNHGVYHPKTFSNIREVESERLMANIHGTFFEVPLLKVGEEPQYELMRPLTTHKKAISDYNTWNGLLILSGINPNASPDIDKHILLSADKKVALWHGGIDDLWKFGKPTGFGGPWKNTKVVAKKPSDPYLMTGYDKKSVTLTADKNVKITLQVNFAHYSGFYADYKTFELRAGEPVVFEFPEGFSCHWIRAVANTDCVATVWFDYK